MQAAISPRGWAGDMGSSGTQVTTFPQGPEGERWKGQAAENQISEICARESTNHFGACSPVGNGNISPHATAAKSKKHDGEKQGHGGEGGGCWGLGPASGAMMGWWKLTAGRGNGNRVCPRRRRLVLGWFARGSQGLGRQEPARPRSRSHHRPQSHHRPRPRPRYATMRHHGNRGGLQGGRARPQVEQGGTGTGTGGRWRELPGA